MHQRFRIKTPEDIMNLQGYVDKVDPDITPLSHIVQRYEIGPFDIPCALCGQRHQEGCIVELANGKKSLTNIGHICGKKFGDKFEQALNQYNEALAKPVLLQKVTEGRSKIDSIQIQLLPLQNQADDLKRRLQRFESKFPETFKGLKRRAINSQFQIFESILRSKEEIDDLMAANRHQDREQLKTKEVLRGAVAGHRFPATDWSSDQSPLRVFAQATQLVDLDPRHLGMPALQRWSNWLDHYEKDIDAVKQVIEEGNLFFSQANFSLFALLPATPQVQAELKALTVAELDRRPAYPPVPTAAGFAKPLGKIRAKPPESTLTPKQLRKLTGNKKFW